MATRFGPGPGAGAQQFPMRPGYMRLGSSNSTTAANGQAYGHQQRPSGGGSGTASPQTRKPDRKDAKEVAWVHWRALKDFLTAFGDKESPTARASAREKLTRLTRLQFLELSTDVYDELMRRLAEESSSSDAAAPFLPVRDDFHPKRNQARQKLATLPKNRFKDLASDVFFELRRRYPEFEAEATKAADNGGGEQEMLHEESPPPGYGGNSGAGGGLKPSSSSSSLASQTRGQQRPTHHRKGSSMGSTSSVDRANAPSVNSQARDRYANLTTPTNDVVVPNKSRLQEEAIEVPYARDSHHEDAEPLLQQRSIPSTTPNGDREHRVESPAPTSGSHDPMSPNATDEQYLDRMSFSSSATAARKGAGGLMSPNGWEDQEHKLRAEYELRIAGLERKLQTTEGERDELQREIVVERERRKDYEDEVRGLKERQKEHTSMVLSMQDELDVSRDETVAVRQEYDQKLRQTEDGLRKAQEEAEQWRQRCEGFEDEVHRLETERAERATREVSPVANGESVADLRNEMRSLVGELQSLSMQNDELMSARDRDREDRSALEAQVDEYRQQATAARTELRNLKATSTMFVSKPLTDDHLPASPDGNIADAHVASFQAGIDSLLAAARSSAPSGVLPSMKAVVEAVTNIGDDVKAFEESPNLDVDVSRLESLKYESTSRLSSLMSAARNHAMASGLAPVSLIDAAAGHLSANVVEIIKLLKIRRTGSTREILHKQNLSIGDMVRRKSGVYATVHETEGEMARSPISPSSPRYAAPERQPSGGSIGLHASPPRGYGLSPIPGSPSSRLGAAPPSAYDAPEFRVKSFQSASSAGKHSESFDLERKASVASRGSDYDRDPFAGSTPTPTPGLRLNSASGSRHSSMQKAPPVPAVTVASSSPEAVRSPLEMSTSPTYFDQSHGAGNAYDANQHPNAGYDGARADPYGGPAPLPNNPFSPTAQNANPHDSYTAPVYGSNNPFAAPYAQQPEPAGYTHQRQFSENHSAYSDRTSAGPDGEWDALKPYLGTQSSALVNHIQNLLAAIRTGGQGPALNEHLSEVIAVSSSIVGVCRASLPPRLQAQGEPLLADLVGNTDRLSEAQQAAARAGGFDKALRQGIASASFGVAKALKAFMKVGGSE